MFVAMPPVYVAFEGTTPEMSIVGLYCTVTVEWHWFRLPCTSLTVRVTVLAPALLQANADGTTESSVTAPQLSALPLLISAGLMVPVPPARSSVKFLQTALGSSLSLTVTVKLSACLLPL